MAGQSQSTPSKQPEASTHPALTYLTLAIAMFERAGIQEEADIFTNFCICHFDTDEVAKAFAESKVDLPAQESARADGKYAHQCIGKVGSELTRKELQGDTVSMWRQELRDYGERLNKREDE